MNRRATRWLVAAGAAWACTAIPARADLSPGEARFFQRCPERPYVEMHQDDRWWDLHTLLYSALGVTEIELLKLMDGMIDLPLPGRPARPLAQMVHGVRGGYHRLPRWGVVQRTGELFDALQLPELSLGDASASYNVATGGTTGPGSGMVVRVNKLTDWLQRAGGDLNRLVGLPIGRPNGAVTSSLPGQAVDGAQWGATKAFNAVQVMVSQIADRALDGLEQAAGGVRNVRYERPHREYTAFLRLPHEIFRAHELWLLEHSSQLVIGPPEQFLERTHADLAHRGAGGGLTQLQMIDRLEGVEPVLIVMTTPRVLARAPASLRAYVLPAAWVLNGE